MIYYLYETIFADIYSHIYDTISLATVNIIENWKNWINNSEYKRSVLTECPKSWAIYR